MQRFSLFILLIAFIVGCRGYQSVSSSTANLTDKEIVGAWNLKTVSGGAPSKINIKSLQAEFSADGKWSYSVSMTGQYEGMELKGSGTYKLSGNELEYTAGENNGKSQVQIKNGLLVFSPDPVVKPNGGKDDVDTEYERAKQ